MVAGNTWLYACAGIVTAEVPTAAEGSHDMAENTVTFKTTGVHCPSCSKNIELSVGDLDGVSSVGADHVSGETRVTFDPAKIDTDRIAGEIRKAGYGAEVV